MDRKGVICLITLIFMLITAVQSSGCVPGKDYSRPVDHDFSSTITYKEMKRTYNVHISSLYDNSKPTPLVIVLHGGGGKGQGMIRLTGFNAIADREHFIVVYPDGFENHWNDGRGVQWQAHIENVDDVGFISTLIDELAGEFNIDSNKIYVTGISNGGMMSHRLACELSQKIVAIAPVASNIPLTMAPIWVPSRPMPVLIINGTEDPLERWEGGEIRLGRKTYGVVLSVADTVKFWTGKDQCITSPIITYLPDKDPSDGTTVTTEVFRGCKDDVEVVLYAIEGGGHTWPGSFQYLPESIIGKTCRDFNASEVIWQFFEKHSLN